MTYGRKKMLYSKRVAEAPWSQQFSSPINLLMISRNFSFFANQIASPANLPKNHAKNHAN